MRKRWSTWLIMEISICLFSLTLRCNNRAANWFQQALSTLVWSSASPVLHKDYTIPELPGKLTNEQVVGCKRIPNTTSTAHGSMSVCCCELSASLAVSAGLMAAFSQLLKFKNGPAFFNGDKSHFHFAVLSPQLDVCMVISSNVMQFWLRRENWNL